MFIFKRKPKLSEYEKEKLEIAKRMQVSSESLVMNNLSEIPDRRYSDIYFDLIEEASTCLGETSFYADNACIMRCSAPSAAALLHQASLDAGVCLKDIDCDILLPRKD